jgi:hypothetical protein
MKFQTAPKRDISILLLHRNSSHVYQILHHTNNLTDLMDHVNHICPFSRLDEKNTSLLVTGNLQP